LNSFFSPYNALVISSSGKKEQADFILSYLHDENSLVMDCFAGDGTLANLICGQGFQVICLEEDWVLFTLMIYQFRQNPFQINIQKWNVPQSLNCILLVDAISYLCDNELEKSLARAHELLETGGFIIMNGPRFHNLRSETERSEVFKSIFGHNTLQKFGSSTRLAPSEYLVDFNFSHYYMNTKVLSQVFSYRLLLREPEHLVQILSKIGKYKFTFFADWRKTTFEDTSPAYVIVAQKIASW
jgi:hypothetical protein